MIVGKTELINIGPREIRKRLLIGIVMLAIGVILEIIFSYSGVSGAWYTALLLPFWIGSLCLSQARKKT